MKRNKSIVMVLMVLVVSLFMGCDMDMEIPPTGAIIDFGLEGQVGKAVINLETETIQLPFPEAANLDKTNLEIIVLQVADFVEEITIDNEVVEVGKAFDFSSPVTLIVERKELPDTEWTVIISEETIDISGSGTEEEPFVIYTLAGLEELGADDYPMDGHYQLGANIDATDTQDGDYNNGNGWEPIGEHGEEEFTGNFDGQGYEITGLYIDRADTEYVGLFSNLADTAVVSNLKLLNFDITGNGRVGALAGINNGHINEVTVSSGQVTAANHFRAGGLVGKNDGHDGNGLIEKSAAIDITVISYHEFAGGLVGINFRGATIRECFSTGYVESIDGGNNGNNFGGLVGGNHRSFIENSYTTVTVTARGNTGGLTGANVHGGLIEASYAVGAVNNEGENVGGLVGVSPPGAANTVASYWDTETTGQDSSQGGTGKTTDQMQEQDTFAQWDFENIWDIDEGNTYPFLQWEN